MVYLLGRSDFELGRDFCAAQDASDENRFTTSRAGEMDPLAAVIEVKKNIPG
jgi:hypothetical protein